MKAIEHGYVIGRTSKDGRKVYPSADLPVRDVESTDQAMFIPTAAEAEWHLARARQFCIEYGTAEIGIDSSHYFIEAVTR